MSKQRSDKTNVDNLSDKIRIKHQPKHVFEHLEPLFDCYNQGESENPNERLYQTLPHSLSGKI